jgi:cytochrome c-type biogenesis protein CcmH/NrfF
MNGWEWVIWGYSLALVGIGAYLVSIVVRTRSAQEHLRDLE